MTTQRLSTAFDAEGRRGQMFPKLTREQVARVSAFGQQKSYADGAILFEQGDRDIPFYVVLEGELEILHPHDSVEHLIVVHGANEFTGEVSMLADRRALVRGRAKGPLRAIRVENARFRELLSADSEISEVLVRAFILRRLGLLSGGHGDVVLVGSQHSAATLRLQEFLVRNGHPYQYVDVDRDPEVEQLLAESKVEASDIPILICSDRHVLKHPTDAEVAECLGLNPVLPKDTVHDVVVCGAGPAGLAAAVYAASEGLKVLVVETGSPGGQAASSSKIENYLGFPTGISGQALTGRALAQAEKFGARLAVARGATRLHCSGKGFIEIDLANGDAVQARAVVIATGAEYRKLDVADLARFEGVGVYYAATFVEAQRCSREDVIVIGGGNSAGQAATFLAQSCRRVHMLVRGPDLASSMSRYLINRIQETPNIELRVRTHVVALHGAQELERVTWRDEKTGEESTHHTRHLFSMAGASPKTEWLRDCVALDEQGFVRTDTSLKEEDLLRAKWSLERRPYLFETSHPRIFAVGDVRSNSVKRVASAVGEGSVCIQLVHKALME